MATTSCSICSRLGYLNGLSAFSCRYARPTSSQQVLELGVVGVVHEAERAAAPPVDVVGVRRLRCRRAARRAARPCSGMVRPVTSSWPHTGRARRRLAATVAEVESSRRWVRRTGARDRDVGTSGCDASRRSARRSARRSSPCWSTCASTRDQPEAGARPSGRWPRRFDRSVVACWATVRTGRSLPGNTTGSSRGRLLRRAGDAGARDARCTVLDGSDPRRRSTALARGRAGRAVLAVRRVERDASIWAPVARCSAAVESVELRAALRTARRGSAAVVHPRVLHAEDLVSSSRLEAAVDDLADEEGVVADLDGLADLAVEVGRGLVEDRRAGRRRRGTGSRSGSPRASSTSTGLVNFRTIARSSRATVLTVNTRPRLISSWVSAVFSMPTPISFGSNDTWRDPVGGHAVAPVAGRLPST